MVKSNNLLLIFLLIQLMSEIVSPDEEVQENSDSIISMLNVVFRTVNDVCSSIDECKLECCQLNELYFIATKNCGANVTDEQLSEVNWKPPFSADQKLSCESACSEKIIGKKQKTQNDKEFQRYLDSGTSERDDWCNNFIEVCFNYTMFGNHFKNLGEMDYFRRFWLPVLGLGLSISVLSFTLIIYLLVPELYNRVQDKCFLFHLSSRILYSIMTLVVFLSEEPGDHFLCKFYAFALQFSGLASAFWLNVICFHLWRCVNSVIPPSKSSFHYFLYAFGSPFMITMMTHLADILLPNEYHSFKPRIGEESCQMKSYNEFLGAQFWLQPRFIYEFNMKIVIQIIDSCIFLHIVYIILSKERGFKKTGNETLRRHQVKQLGLLIYLKLFLLMGLTTIFDLILLHFGRSNVKKLFPSFINAILLFVIFVLNKRVFHMGRKRFTQLFSQSTIHRSSAGNHGALIMEQIGTTKSNTVEPIKSLSSTN